MKSFCISLEREKKKWPELIQMFKKNNLDNISIFPGVEGKQIESYFKNNMDQVSPYTKNLIESYGGDTMISSWALYHLLQKTSRRDHVQLGTFGAIGCYLSHILLWQKMLEENLPSIVIFEDDVKLNNNFSTEFQKTILQMPEDADVIFLGICVNFQSEPYNNFFNIVAGQFFGLHGYIITNNGAKKLLKYLFPIEVQLDALMSFQNIFKRLRLYTLTNQICEQSVHVSSIQAVCYLCEFSENDIEKLNKKFLTAIILVSILLLVIFLYLILKIFFSN